MPKGIFRWEESLWGAPEHLIPLQEPDAVDSAEIKVAAACSEPVERRAARVSAQLDEDERV